MNHRRDIIIKVTTILVPIAIITYVLLMNLYNVGRTYTVDIGGKQDTNENNTVFLVDLTNEGRISERMSYDGVSYREVLTEKPAYIFVRPPTSFQKIIVELRFMSGSEIDITTTDLAGHFRQESLGDWTIARKVLNRSDIILHDDDKIVFGLLKKEGKQLLIDEFKVTFKKR